METNRRNFLMGTAWMGATAALSGCFTSSARVVGRGGMTAFSVAPLEKVRVGVIGLGMRGPGAVHRLASIPGVEVVALCDLYPERVERQQKWLVENGHPEAVGYDGPEGYKALCDSDLDLVYNATPWAMHVPIALYAMNRGKHVAIEVPSAMTVDDCWALVETAEKTGRHCMQLENCCYGEVEMLALNLVRQGKLGDLVHGEGAYIHDLRELGYLDPSKGGYSDYWRLKWNEKHTGNPYPTHGLLPIMQAMNVNRGDRLEYLSCIASAQVGMDAFAATRYGSESWQAKLHPACGDMSTTVIRTAKGRTIMVQHDVTSPRPYSRINLLSGTMGILSDYPYRLALADRPGGGAHAWFSPEKAKEYAEEYRHPLWKAAGALAKKLGGHGGMDFLMDLRLCYCLQNGLPLDMDVYDLAASCSVAELSEKSARRRGDSVDIPDFTRGGWETAKPLGIVTVDMKKLGLSEDVKKDEAQLNV